MKEKPLVLILAGGSGTRLWPLSREKKPKQLLALYSKKSLIKETFERAQLIASRKDIYIGTGLRYKKEIASELKITDKQFICESEGKNTAPIIALFAKTMGQKKKNLSRPLVILSADHFIGDIKKWKSAIQQACQVRSHLVCIGVEPSRADTGYGYIEAGDKLNAHCRKIISFREKPDAVLAQEYLKSGRHFWNSGMFVFPCKLFLKELAWHNPQIDTLTNKALEGLKQLKKSFAQMPNISIDYALLEKSNRLAMVSASFQWDDVGSFEAITRICGKDEAGNTPAPTAAYRSIDSKNNIIYAKRPVALLGVSDLVIVESKDVLLIAHRDHLSKIKKIRAEFIEYL